MTRGKGCHPAPPLPTSPAVFLQNFEFPAHRGPPPAPSPSSCCVSCLEHEMLPLPRPSLVVPAQHLTVPHTCPYRLSWCYDVLVCSSKLGSPAGRGPVQVLWQPRAPHTMPGRAGPCRMWSPSLPIQIWVPERPDGPPQILYLSISSQGNFS